MPRRFGLLFIRVLCEVVQALRSHLRKQLALGEPEAWMSISISGPIAGPHTNGTTRSSRLGTCRQSGCVTLIGQWSRGDQGKRASHGAAPLGAFGSPLWRLRWPAPRSPRRSAQQSAQMSRPPTMTARSAITGTSPPPSRPRPCRSDLRTFRSVSCRPWTANGSYSLLPGARPPAPLPPSSDRLSWRDSRRLRSRSRCVPTRLAERPRSSARPVSWLLA